MRFAFAAAARNRKTPEVHLKTQALDHSRMANTRMHPAQLMIESVFSRIMLD